VQLPQKIVGPAHSALGAHSERVNIGEDDILIALRAYLDSSGKLEDHWMTLAAAASTDVIWGELEKAWDEILQKHTPKGSYIHMKEVYRLEKAFDKKLGWNHDSAFGLVNNCLSYISTRPKDQFRVFYCSVDLHAWQKLRAETYQMPEPIDLCNTFCSEFVLTWYGFFLNPTTTLMDPKTDSVRYFFDRNEYFFQPFFEKWNRARNHSDATGTWSIWNAIDEVAPVDMKKTPGIQVADIIAWARNRETFTKDGDLAHYLPQILKSVIPTSYVIWDEEKLRQQYKPLIHLP
jgi:hypothetical protein